MMLRSSMMHLPRVHLDAQTIRESGKIIVNYCRISCICFKNYFGKIDFITTFMTLFDLETINENLNLWFLLSPFNKNKPIHLHSVTVQNVTILEFIMYPYLIMVFKGPLFSSRLLIVDIVQQVVYFHRIRILGKCCFTSWRYFWFGGNRWFGALFLLT